MRRFAFAVLLAAGGCIHGSSAPQRDSNALRAIAQQERWAQDALSRRPDRTELQAIRSSDFTAVGRGRGELKRLLQAIDRATWMRNTAAELMLDDADPQLAATFDRAARMRADAIQAADELASALAEAKGGLTIGDLRPGLEAVRKAQAPSPTLTVANDAAVLISKRIPRSITLREDGLFELSYDDADYLVDPQGKLVRKEAK